MLRRRFNDRIIRTRELGDMLGVSRATINRWKRKGVLPPSIRLGPNSVGWRASEIEEWFRGLPQSGPQSFKGEA